MTIFKTYLKILNKYKATVILYTALLIIFGGFNMQTTDNTMSFIATKPDVYIVNKDEEIGITKDLIHYMKDASNFIKIKNEEEAIEDAIFYRDVNYVIYIPKNYREDFLAGKNPQVQIKATGDYQSSLANILLNRYLSLARIYQNEYKDETVIISKIHDTLKKQAEVKITSKLDTNGLEKSTFYYNFLSYSMLAGTIYIICLILSSFHNEKVRKRTLISSMEIKKQNRILLFSNLLFMITLWLIYVILSMILCKEVMFTTHGLLYILNSFVFSIVCVTMAFFISTLVTDKNAINGIVNVVALGCSFLSGAFVPVQFLPDFVLKIAHVLPTYWYIHSNELLKEVETFDFSTLKPFWIDLFVMVLFCVIFIVLSNVISKKKSKIG